MRFISLAFVAPILASTGMVDRFVPAQTTAQPDASADKQASRAALERFNEKVGIFSAAQDTRRASHDSN